MSEKKTTFQKIEEAVIAAGDQLVEENGWDIDDGNGKTGRSTLFFRVLLDHIMDAVCIEELNVPVDDRIAALEARLKTEKEEHEVSRRRLEKASQEMLKMLEKVEAMKLEVRSIDAQSKAWEDRFDRCWMMAIERTGRRNGD